MRNKKGQAQWLAIVAVIALVMIAVVAALAFLGGSDKAASLVGGVDAKAVSSSFQCESSTTPSLSINAFDARNVGTADTEATNLYRKKGDSLWSSFTAGTGFAANPGDVLEVVMGISTTDFTDNSYGGVFEVTVPCEEEPSIEKPVYLDEVETSLTATYFNADKDAATAETFSTGQTQDVYVSFAAATDEFFGNPYIALEETSSGSDGQRARFPNVACVQLNSSAWDKPVKYHIAESLTINLGGDKEITYTQGEELKSVNAPGRLAGSATDNTYCFEYPLVADTAQKVALRLNADDTNAPPTDETLSLFAANYYIDSDDGQVKWGVENEEDAAVGTDAADTLTLDFTS